MLPIAENGISISILPGALGLARMILGTQNELIKCRMINTLTTPMNTIGTYIASL
jgi:hypothetical protein